MATKTDTSYNELKAVESNARTYADKFQMTVKNGQGVYLYDTEGTKYFDCLANAGTLAFGHNHAKLAEAGAKFFTDGLPYQTVDLSTESKHGFVSTLFTMMSPNLRENGRIQFCGPAGTDATEAAIKLCKISTGRSDVICFSGGYHGHTNGALAMMGNLSHKNVPNLMPGVHFMPYPYSYRCPFGLGGEQGTKVCLEYLKRLLDDPEGGVMKPAAIILEPIQGEGGVIPAPIEFLQGLREITRERDIPLIFDEIQCGFCRSGKYFAYQYSGIEPDVVCLSKALGGGMPLACLIYDKKLDTWAPGDHAGTFRGNQLAMTLGKVSLDMMINDNLCEHVLEVGGYLLEKLDALKKEVQIIGDIRGKGLMIGVEIIDPKSEPDLIGSFKASGEKSLLIQRKCFENKMIIERGGRFGAIVRFLPPLIITKEEIDECFTIFSAVVREVDAL